MKIKILIEKNGYKLIRITDRFGGFHYVINDAEGNFVRDVKSVCDIENMPELFPGLAKQ